MALLFDADGELVNCGTGASLNNITVGTCAVWVNLTSTANQRFIQKATTNFRIFRPDGSNFVMQIQRATSQMVVNATYANIPTTLTTGKWMFLAATYTLAGANGDQHLYGGDLATSATEVTTYTSQLVGSGAHGDDSASPFILGNSAVAGTVEMLGSMAWAGFWNRQLSLGELQDQQFRPHPTSGCVGFWVPGYAGTGTQPDWSGAGNNGTVTGATVTSHMPIPFRRSRGLWVPTTVAAAGKPWTYYAQQMSS